MFWELVLPEDMELVTIPSLLQMKLNEEGLTEYKVVNWGTGG